jgi:hypothetical protein
MAWHKGIRRPSFQQKEQRNRQPVNSHRVGLVRMTATHSVLCSAQVRNSIDGTVSRRKRSVTRRSNLIIYPSSESRQSAVSLERKNSVMNEAKCSASNRC